MKNYILTLSLLFLFSVTNGQGLYIGYGPIYTLSKAISPIRNAKENFENSAFVSTFTYEHFLKNKKVSVIAKYCFYSNSTTINYESGGLLDDFGNVVGADGWGGTNIYRLDLMMGYNLLNLRRFYIKPFGGIGLQLSRNNDIGIFEIPVNGPYYVQTEPMIADAFNTFQVVPTAGIRAGFLF